MATLPELHAQLEAKHVELFALTDGDDASPEAVAKAEVVSAEIDKIEGEVKRQADASARMAEIKARGAASADFLNRPAPGGVPFHGRIEAGKSEAEKTKSCADWIKTIASLGSQDTSYPAKQRASERLQKLYGSEYKDWSGSEYKAALAENSGILGGYLAPPEYSNDFLRVAIEQTILGQRARQFPISGSEIHVPMLDQTTAQAAGSTAFTGGMIASWTGEAATRSETEPQFKQLSLKPNELAGYSKFSRNLMQDSGVAVQSLLEGLIRDTVAWYEDMNFLRGDGVAKPRGILGHPATVTVSRGTPSHFTWPDVAAMEAKLYSPSDNAFWVIQTSVKADLFQLKDPANRLVFLPTSPPDQGSAQAKPKYMLLGRPVYVTEKLPTLGTAGDVMLIDPSFYLVGRRMELEIAISDQAAFLNNQMVVRFIARTTGRPWLDKPFTLSDATTQVSPFVSLT